MLSRRSRPSPNPPDGLWWIEGYRPQEILKTSIHRQPLHEKRSLGSSFLAWTAGMTPKAVALERRAKLDWKVRERDGVYYWRYHERKPEYVWISKAPAETRKVDEDCDDYDDDDEDDDEEGSSCSKSCCTGRRRLPAGIEWAQYDTPHMQEQSGIEWSFPPKQGAPQRGRRRRMESPVRTDWSNQYVAQNGRDGLPAIYANIPPMRVWH